METLEQNQENQVIFLKSIQYTNGEFIITDGPMRGGQDKVHYLPGVLCKGIQYYDLANIGFISNSGIANLIDFLKSLLKQGVEIQLVNVSQPIREKISALGLEQILKCS